MQTVTEMANLIDERALERPALGARLTDGETEGEGTSRKRVAELGLTSRLFVYSDHS